jgi:hypothetical protein
MTLYGSGSGFDGKLNLDFKDFFPSLNAGDFRGFLRRQKTALEPGDADALERILFWKPKGSNLLCLSIRAPSFPLLSNLLLADFDSQVTKICAANDVAYTRYADDLSFSADVSSKISRRRAARGRAVQPDKQPKAQLLSRSDPSCRLFFEYRRSQSAKINSKSPASSIAATPLRYSRPHFPANCTRLSQPRMVMKNRVISPEVNK